MTVWFNMISFRSIGSNCQGIYYCGDGKHCDSEHQPEPKCVCNTDCPKTYNPICGSNNKTYNNTCELQQEACLTNTSITQQFNGKCDEGNQLSGLSPIKGKL